MNKRHKNVALLCTNIATNSYLKVTISLVNNVTWPQATYTWCGKGSNSLVLSLIWDIALSSRYVHIVLQKKLYIFAPDSLLDFPMLFFHAFKIYWYWIWKLKIENIFIRSLKYQYSVVKYKKSSREYELIYAHMAIFVFMVCLLFFSLTGLWYNVA